MSHEHTAIIQIAAIIGYGGNLLQLSKSKNAPFTDADSIVGISFEGFLFKDGKSSMGGCKGTLSEDKPPYMQLTIAPAASPEQAIILYYHAITGEYRLESKGIPFDNVETIVLKIVRDDQKKRRVTDVVVDVVDDGFDTTAAMSQFQTNLDAKYGRRKEHLTADGAMDKALDSAKSLVALALECQEATKLDASANTAEYWRSMTLMLNQIRDNAIARSEESDFVLSTIWVLPKERIAEIKNRGKDHS